MLSGCFDEIDPALLNIQADQFDPDLVAHKSYGAWGKKVMYGKHIEGTLRSTFLIAPNGRIAQVWRSVRVDGHADAVIAALLEATTGAAPAKSAPKRTAAKSAPAKAKAAKARAPKRARRT